MKKILLVIFSIWVVGRVQAQMSAAGSEYFQPGYAYRHVFNPAFVPQTGYVAIPVLGTLNLTVVSNLGLADFLYPLPSGELGNFLHPDVSAEEFLENIRKDNYLNLSLNASLLSAGWFWGRSFWTFDIQLKGGFRSGIPYEFFEFAKKEMSENPTRYRIEDMRIDLQSYVEMGIGYAREVGPEFTVGGKFKFLVGLAQAELRVNRMDVSLSDEAWNVSSDADFRVFGRLVDVDFVEGQSMPEFGMGQIAPSGYGAAIDLGVEYRPSFLPGLRFSASVLDLGFISYKKEDIEQFTAQGDVMFDGFDNLGMGMDMEVSVRNLTGELMEMIAFEQTPVQENMCRMVTPTLNFGAEYGIWGNRFSIGLLNTTVFYSSHVESDLSLIGSIHPCRWFSASVAYSFIGGNRGLGWSLNFTPSYGLNLFLASNYTPLSVNTQFIPLKKAHANIQVGLTVPIGNNRRYTYEAEVQDANYFPYTSSHPEIPSNRYSSDTEYEEDDYNGPVYVE